MDFNAVVHDLRTPLNVMLGHVQLLTFEGLSDTGRDRIRVLEAQVHRMLRLIDDYAGQRPDLTHPAPVDLSVMIGNVVSELDALLEPRGIEIRATIRDALPSVLGDADLLHRVLVNVLINAADSISDTGLIQITADAEWVADSRPGAVHIRIADTGAGIPPESIARVFDHGFTTKACAPTHGLGLGICRQIVQMHGGRIHLSSEPGQGTTVHLSLPIWS